MVYTALLKHYLTCQNLQRTWSDSNRCSYRHLSNMFLKSFIIVSIPTSHRRMLFLDLCGSLSPPHPHNSESPGKRRWEISNNSFHLPTRSPRLIPRRNRSVAGELCAVCDNTSLCGTIQGGTTSLNIWIISKWLPPNYSVSSYNEARAMQFSPSVVSMLPFESRENGTEKQKQTVPQSTNLK